MKSYFPIRPRFLFLLPLFAWPLLSSAETVVPSAAFNRTIHLVRHGAYVPDAKAESQLGPGLTPLGLAQARLTAHRLRGMPFRFDAMTSSTMTRARQTAAVIDETLPEVTLEASSDFAECTPPANRDFEDVTTQQQAACAKRLDAAFAARFTPATGAARNELIVAHGNVIRYMTTKALGVDARTWLQMSVAHTSLTIIQVRPDGTMKVLAVGDTGHIPPNLLSWGTDTDPQLEVPKH